jgi:hypothetical protein
MKAPGIPKRAGSERQAIIFILFLRKTSLRGLFNTRRIAAELKALMTVLNVFHAKRRNAD